MKLVSSSSPLSWLLLPPFLPATSRNTKLPATLPQATRHQSTLHQPTPHRPTLHQATTRITNTLIITVTSQSDERNIDGSSQWSYAQSDYTTREESQAQKKMQGVTYDSYGKESYGEVLGNTNKGSSYWVSPEGEKLTLTWAADEAGFQPKGDPLARRSRPRIRAPSRSRP
ncbi:uncharacterized protein LOC116915471 [Daphnia magna]|uniref:uncharacterized protein LOC116915471 n=1 Tax=Daphnia magna TaxID=35525 RepID=UPI001E1BB860|nr:uncharacterized protein LOC116915471 [Daphnia magna]